MNVPGHISRLYLPIHSTGRNRIPTNRPKYLVPAPTLQPSSSIQTTRQPSRRFGKNELECQRREQDCRVEGQVGEPADG